MDKPVSINVSEEFNATISAEGEDWRTVLAVAHQYLQGNPRVKVLALTTSDSAYGMEGQHVPARRRKLELRLGLQQPHPEYGGEG